MEISLVNTGFFGWCMDMLRGLEAARTPFMDKLMSALTVLGEEMAFIALGLVIFWCVSKRFGYRFIFIYLLGAVVNQVLKALFMIPRPWVIDGRLSIVESAREGASGFSFPSGHTQSAVLMYGGIASAFKGRAGRILACVAALIVAIVGFSRMYLGVHTLLDVGVSLITGVIILALLMRKNSRFGERPGAYLAAAAGVCAAAAGLIVLINAVCVPADLEPYYNAAEKAEMIGGSLKDAWTLLGSALGLLLGYFVETKFVDFDPKAVWWAQIIKVVVGLAVILGLRIGLKAVLGMISNSPAMNCVRYFILTFVGVAVLPILFKLFPKKA